MAGLTSTLGGTQTLSVATLIGLEYFVYFTQLLFKLGKHRPIIRRFGLAPMHISAGRDSVIQFVELSDDPLPSLYELISESRVEGHTGLHLR